jgi:hypothetical protein
MEELVFKDAGLIGLVGYIAIKEGRSLFLVMTGRGDRLARLEGQFGELDRKVDQILAACLAKNK